MVCQKLSLYNDIRHKTIGAVKIYCSAWVFRTVLVDWTLLLTFSPSSVPRATCRAGGWRGGGARACTVLGQPFPAVKWRRGPAAAASSYPGSHGHLSEIILNTVISRRGSAAVAVMGLNCELRVRRCWYGHSSGGTSALHTPGRTHPHIHRYRYPVCLPTIVGNSGILPQKLGPFVLLAP